MESSTAQRAGSARVAGIVGLAGGLLGVAFAVYELATLPYEVGLAANLRGVLLHLAAIVTLAGAAALGATGSWWWGRAGIGVAMLGFVVLIVAELVEPFDLATAETLYGVAPLLLGVGLVAAGVAVLRARHWSGWRRAVPLMFGLYVLLVFLPVAITIGSDAAVWSVLLGWWLVLAALGLAVVQEASARVGSRAGLGV